MSLEAGLSKRTRKRLPDYASLVAYTCAAHLSPHGLISPIDWLTALRGASERYSDVILRLAASGEPG